MKERLSVATAFFVSISLCRLFLEDLFPSEVTLRFNNSATAYAVFPFGLISTRDLHLFLTTRKLILKNNDYCFLHRIKMIMGGCPFLHKTVTSGRLSLFFVKVFYFGLRQDAVIYSYVVNAAFERVFERVFPCRDAYV